MKTQISEIVIIPLKPKEAGNKTLVALATCVMDNKIYLGSIGIYVLKDGGYKITYPTKTSGYNSINIYHLIDKEAGDALENSIIEKYEELMTKDL